MLCLETMSSGPNSYLNMVNIDMKDCVTWVLSRPGQAQSASSRHRPRDAGQHTTGSSTWVAPRSSSTSDHVILPPTSLELTRSTTTASHTATGESPKETSIKHTYCNHNQLSQSLTHIPQDEQYKYLQSVIRNQKIIELCGFYYDTLDMRASRRKLKHSPEGHFLLRCSSDPKHLFSLSVKTSRGPTSVRIVYQYGSFRLDCDSNYITKMPKFHNVMELIQYYVRNSEHSAKEKSQCYWLENSGRKEVPVVLKMPHRHTVSSLKHLCRRNIHKQCDTADSNDLLSKAPSRLHNYLTEYPYWL